MLNQWELTEALDAHREVTECQIFSIYKSEKELKDYLPMPIIKKAKILIYLLSCWYQQGG